MYLNMAGKIFMRLQEFFRCIMLGRLTKVPRTLGVNTNIRFILLSPKPSFCLLALLRSPLEIKFIPSSGFGDPSNYQATIPMAVSDSTLSVREFELSFLHYDNVS